MSGAGYPPIVLLLVLVVGLPLAVFRPYWAFLWAVFLLAGRNVDAFIFTRSGFLGPFFNLNDACFMVAIVALLNDRSQRSGHIRIPRVVGAITLVLTIGALQMLVAYGASYNTLRAVRWAIVFPLMFLLAANFVTDGRRARLLVAALLGGAVLSSLQHLQFVVGVQRAPGSEVTQAEQLRTCAFLGPGMWFLITGVIWDLPREGWKKIACIVLGGLFLSSVLLFQGRAVWISTFLGVPVLLLLLPGAVGGRRLFNLGIGVGVAFAAGLVVMKVVPWVAPRKLVAQRVATLSKGAEDPSTAGRLHSFYYELKDWSEGTLILGRGLGYQQYLPRTDRGKNIGYGHLGYVTYLSQLGLLGLFVYGLYLPFSVLRDCRSVWLNDAQSANRYVALLAAASMVSRSIGFVMSASFLQESWPVVGILSGTAWALARQVQGRVPAAVFAIRPAGTASGMARIVHPVGWLRTARGLRRLVLRRSVGAKQPPHSPT